MAASLELLLYAVRLRSALKFVDVTRIWDILQGYLISDDADIRGLSILIVANLASLDSTRGAFNLRVSASDITLLITAYTSFKQEALLGDFLANTAFPELCLLEIRNYLTLNSGNEVIQVCAFRHLHLHTFSDPLVLYVLSLLL